MTTAVDATAKQPDVVERRRLAAVAGYRKDEAAARAALADPAGDVRATALGALQRMGRLDADDVEQGVLDPDAAVRRRACELSAPTATATLVKALGDSEQLVVEAACFALGERGQGADATADAVAALSRVATAHKDPLCREAAVAALGAIGDPAGLTAILRGIDDKPAVRRRAIIALSPFDGPEVDEALERARADRDWQVRQAAEDLS